MIANKELLYQSFGLLVKQQKLKPKKIDHPFKASGATVVKNMHFAFLLKKDIKYRFYLLYVIEGIVARKANLNVYHGNVR